jgi:hypothetical protein
MRREEAGPRVDADDSDVDAVMSKVRASSARKVAAVAASFTMSGACRA